MKYKNLQIDPEVHHKLHVYTVKKRDKLRFLAERIILEYLEKHDNDE
jgi:hypothetical protein